MKCKVVIWRHRKERLSKCSLHGLESRDDLTFLRYPDQPLTLSGQVVLTPDAPLLETADQLVLLDGTWRYASKMVQALQGEYTCRSLPPLQTAYPRRQDERGGLASIEALYAAYTLLGWPTAGLLDHYRWADGFLDLNKELG